MPEYVSLYPHKTLKRFNAVPFQCGLGPSSTHVVSFASPAPTFLSNEKKAHASLQCRG